MKPIVLFSIQFTLSLAAYALIAAWYVIPRLAGKPREVALRTRLTGAIALVWAVVVVGAADTINAIIQSMHYNVFIHPLTVNWVIVTVYVPALLVSSALILWQLIRSPAAMPVRAARTTGP